MVSRCRCLCLLAGHVFALVQLAAQLPQGAQTDLYFPHLADGGPASAQWQTRFTFINPNSTTVGVVLYLYSNGGAPLTLNLGTGPASQINFTIPANGTVVLQSQIASSSTTTGWAIAGASLPVQANVAFRLIQGGVARLEITAEPTLPSTSYRSVASPQVGMAVANGYNNSALAVKVTV
jgi:hypothetical protein